MFNAFQPIEYELVTVYGTFRAPTLDELVQKVLVAMDVWDAGVIRAMARTVEK